MSLLFRKASQLEQRAPSSAVIPGPTDMGGGGGLPWVTDERALRHSAVWACVDLRAGIISSFPIDVYRGAGATKTALPTPAVLDRPEGDWDIAEFLWAGEACLSLRGNFYALVLGRDPNSGKPSILEPVHPDTVQVLSTNGSVTGYRIGDKAFAPEDVWHVRRHRMPGSAVGMSAIEHARRAIVLGLAAEEFGARFFDSPHPSGVLKSANALTEEQAMRAEQRWEARMTGRRGTAVLGAGWDWAQISVNPDDSQFLDTISANAAMISRFFGVPPELIGASSGAGTNITYANREQRAADFLAYHLAPSVRMWERALTALTPRGQFVKLNTDALLRADLATQAQVEATRLANGVMTPDEVRDKHDLPPLPGGVGTIPNWPPGGLQGASNAQP